MKAEEIVMRLEGLGIAMTIVEDRVRLKPGSRVPKELAEQISHHKQEVIAYLKARSLNESGRFKYGFPDGRNPPEEKLKEISHEVEAQGYVLLWSTELEDFIAFYRADSDLKSIPPGFVLYSDQELWHLFGNPESDLSINGLRLIHAAKKEGARVIGNGEEESE